MLLHLFFFFFFLGYRGIVHPPSDNEGTEPGLSPNNDLENSFLSDQSMAGNPRKGLHLLLMLLLTLLLPL